MLKRNLNIHLEQLVFYNVHNSSQSVLYLLGAAAECFLFYLVITAAELRVAYLVLPYLTFHASTWQGWTMRGRDNLQIGK